MTLFIFIQHSTEKMNIAQMHHYHCEYCLSFIKVYSAIINKHCPSSTHDFHVTSTSAIANVQ